MFVNDLIDKLLMISRKNGNIPVNAIFSYCDQDGVINTKDNMEINVGSRGSDIFTECFIQLYCATDAWEKIR